MKKIIAKIFSPWGLVPLIMALLCNFAVYSGCNALTRNWNLHSLAIPLDKIFAIIFFILFVLLFFIPRMIGEAFSEDLQSNQEAVPETPYIPL